MPLPHLNEMFPLFRSTDLTRVVVELFLSEKELSMSELSRIVGCTRESISKAAPSLIRSGILKSRSEGRSVLLSADTSSVFYGPLRRLLEITCGAPKVLEQEFKNVTGISEIHIFGSWAERALGVSGPMPDDIDVIIIGDVSPVDVSDASVRAGVVLNRAVNCIPCSETAWVSESDAFVKNIKTGSLVPVPHTKLELSDDEVTGPGSNSSADDDWAKNLFS